MKKILIILMTTIMLITLVGCSKNNNTVNNNGKELIEETTNSESIEESENAEETNNFVELNFLERIPLSPEWENATDIFTMQVYDMMVYPGETIKGFMEKVENSEYEYEIYDYNPNELITAWKTKNISMKVKDHDETFVDIVLYNNTDETITLENTVITRIYSEIYSGFLYIIGGKTYGDFIDMTYDEIKDYGNKYFGDWTITEADETEYLNIFDGCMALQYSKSVNNRQGSIIFYIDKETSKTKFMDFNFRLDNVK